MTFCDEAEMQWSCFRAENYGEVLWIRKYSLSRPTGFSFLVSAIWRLVVSSPDDLVCWLLAAKISGKIQLKSLESVHSFRRLVYCIVWI
jgi:hypothetical protein